MSQLSIILPLKCLLHQRKFNERNERIQRVTKNSICSRSLCSLYQFCRVWLIQLNRIVVVQFDLTSFQWTHLNGHLFMIRESYFGRTCRSRCSPKVKENKSLNMNCSYLIWSKWFACRTKLPAERDAKQNQRNDGNFFVYVIYCLSLVQSIL